MEATGRTETEYLAAISQVVAYVQASLDESITPGKLARVAGFSPHHFHRIFRAIVGESVMDFVRRLRLERAAYRLKSSQVSVATVALDAAYGSQEAFARVFQAYFGLAPRDYRRGQAAYRLPSTSGVHYSPTGCTPLRKVAEPELLASDRLCAAHRQAATAFDAYWEEMLAHLTGLSSLVFRTPFGGSDSGSLRNPMIETHTDIDREIEALQNEIDAAKQRLIEARRRRPKERVADYELKSVEGTPVRLSELFGEKDDLIVVHNMGTGCSSCTMWADGFSGLAPHLMDRASFVVCSPDKPEVQKRFALKRNWGFRMVSAHDSPFPRDMGFWQDEGPNPRPWPGVSTFRREPDGTIVRIAKAFFDAGDDFCAVWPLFELLERGVDGWEPKYTYGESRP